MISRTVKLNEELKSSQPFDDVGLSQNPKEDGCPESISVGLGIHCPAARMSRTPARSYEGKSGLSYYFPN